MKYIKSVYRSSLHDKHLKSGLMIGQRNFNPQMNLILAGRSQCHGSQHTKFKELYSHFQGVVKTDSAVFFTFILCIV